MTTREAARPLRRYMRARVRAASLAPTYTITRDVTSRRPKNEPPACAPDATVQVRHFDPVSLAGSGRFDQANPRTEHINFHAKSVNFSSVYASIIVLAASA